MTSPRTLLTAWNLTPRKQLGQNFLADPSTAEMIVRRCGITSDHVVLEIGAGLGALTIPIARNAKKVYALDKDSRLISLLKTELLVNGLSNVELIEKNILDLDITALSREAGQKLLVMGNLPYNISSQILVQLIHARASVIQAVLMFQKELAQRIMASPGCKDYGRLTVMLRYCSDISSLAHIRASQFFPRPKVDSEVVRITFKEILHPANDEAFFFKVIKAAFGQRRKNLKNSLSGSELHIEPDIARNALEAADIDPVRRAETLTVEEFLRLTHHLGFLIADF